MKPVSLFQAALLWPPFHTMSASYAQEAHSENIKREIVQQGAPSIVSYGSHNALHYFVSPSAGRCFRTLEHRDMGRATMAALFLISLLPINAGRYSPALVSAREAALIQSGATQDWKEMLSNTEKRLPVALKQAANVALAVREQSITHVIPGPLKNSSILTRIGTKRSALLFTLHF